MSKKQDTQLYHLKQENKVVYTGTTNDLERRVQEHRSEGKKFNQVVASRRMTADGAKKKESASLATYRKNHGKNPKYNKDSDG